MPVNVNLFKAVRAQLDVDLLNFDGPLLTRLSSDYVLLVDVLWIACAKQAQELDIDDEEFGERLADGEVIDAASTALLEGIVNFTPPAKRVALRAALAQIKVLQKKEGELRTKMVTGEKMMQATQRSMELAEAQFETMIDQVGRPETPGPSCGDSPESPESPIPENTPGAS